MNVLTVDVQAPDAATLFPRSIHETGFAVLINHPISQNLFQELYHEWGIFFNHPDKYSYTFDPKTQAGYFPFKSENAKGYPVKDLKEFYHYYPWSQKLPTGTKHATQQLFKELSALGVQLLSWIDAATPAEIKQDFSMPLQKMVEDSPDTLFRILHYPPIMQNEDENAIRAAAHEDIDFMTLLPAATSMGLQTKDTQGNWHDISCDPGTIVVNAGDMLQTLTKGYYRSTTHRVINPVGDAARVSRYSAPLFVHPRGNVKLSEKHTACSYLSERLMELGLLTQEERIARLKRDGLWDAA